VSGIAFITTVIAKCLSEARKRTHGRRRTRNRCLQRFYKAKRLKEFLESHSSEHRKERKARKNDLEWDGGKVAVLKFGGIMELQYLCRHNSDNHKDDGE